MKNKSRAHLALHSTIVSGVATLLAAVSHMLAGGNEPTLPALVATMIIALPLVLLFLRLNLGVLTLTLAVFSTQGIFHSIFVYTRPATKAIDALPAHAEHLGLVKAIYPAVIDVNHASALMLLAHFIAALLTVWVLKRGEIALSKLLHSLKRIFWSIQAFLPRVEPQKISHTLFCKGAENLPVLHLSTLSHRGPPNSFSASK